MTPERPDRSRATPRARTLRPEPPERAASDRAGRRRAAGLAGPAGAQQPRRRCCAACSRRGDWLALIGRSASPTAATSTTDVATLFWAVLFSPS